MRQRISLVSVAALLALVLAAAALTQWRAAVLEERATGYWLRILDVNGKQTARVIEEWLRERGQDAAVSASSASGLLGSTAGTGESGEHFRGPLADDLSSLVSHRRFQEGWVIGRGGEVVSASEGAGLLSAQEKAALTTLLASREPGRAGPWRDPTGAVAISFLAPVVAPSGELLGSVVLRADLRSLLETLSWKLEPSRTGQIRLLGALGDSIFVLSPSRFPAGAPFRVGVPAAAAPPLWRRALRTSSTTGVHHDLDSARVLAATRVVAGSGWALVRTITAAEALGGVRTRARTEAILVIALALVLALSGLLLRRITRAAEARSAAAALRASDLRHRTLFDRNPLPMWLYDSGTLRILAVNAAALDAFGYSREELVEMRVTELAAPEDLDGLLDKLPGAGGGRAEAGVHRLRKKGGRTVEVEIISDDTPVDGRPARLLLAHDVSRARVAERAVREAHATLATLVDSSPLAIVTLDRNDLVCSWNSAAERMFGWAAHEVLDRPCPLVPPEERGAHEEQLAAVFGSLSSAVSMEARRCRRDGSLVDVYVLSAPLRNEEGEVYGSVGFIADVTERVQLEEQLRQAQKMEAVGRLAGGVAHDFNNLVTVIKGYSELVLSDLPEDSQWKPDIEEVVKAADRATGLTSQLLLFSRKQVGSERTLDVNALILDVHRMLARLVGEDIRFVFDLSSEVPFVHADPGQLEQILVNLAVNSRDAMPLGGELRISTSLVESRAAEAAAGGTLPANAEGYVLVRVADTGCGMSPAVMRHVFEPFFTTKAQGKGTGLGLATVYGIVQRARGAIAVKSVLGAGTCISIYLPRAEDPETAGCAPGSAPPAEAGRGTVLVAEDEPAVRELVRRALVHHGYRVLEAEDGRKALERAAEHEGRLDLLITDVMMPEMRGPALARELLLRRPGVPVLYISGYTDGVLSGAERDALDDASLLLRKPFSSAQLLELVHSALSRSALRAA